MFRACLHYVHINRNVGILSYPKSVNISLYEVNFPVHPKNKKKIIKYVENLGIL